MPNKPGTPPNTSLILTDEELDFIKRFYGSKSAAIKKGLELLMHSYDYSVIEDNAGGLHLFLFHPRSDTPARYFADFEYSPGSLVEALDALDAGDDTTTWDGARGDGSEAWDYISSHKHGYEVICYSEDGQRTIKPDKMGAAGRIEFGIEAD